MPSTGRYDHIGQPRKVQIPHLDHLDWGLDPRTPHRDRALDCGAPNLGRVRSILRQDIGAMTQSSTNLCADRSRSVLRALWSPNSGIVALPLALCVLISGLAPTSGSSGIVAPHLERIGYVAPVAPVALGQSCHIAARAK